MQRILHCGKISDNNIKSVFDQKIVINKDIELYNDFEWYKKNISNG